MKKNKLVAIFFFIVCCCVANADELNNQKPLRVGMLPSLSLQKLFERFSPLRTYLEKTLNRPVILLTASDYQTYIKRASEYEYDLYFTAPHMAALAEADSGYRRVALLTRDLSGYLIVCKDGPVKSIKDLKGRTISAPETLAIITMMGEALLQENNLIPGKDVKISKRPVKIQQYKVDVPF